METLALKLAFFWSQWLWPILQFVIGLGLVVFIHELGHFLVAKWVGIKVERFALGFGPRLFGVKLGETDYCVNALPLGGYVKMLGQEDFKPLEEGQADPRAYNNKSVGARMAVISAGVIMNAILAAVLFMLIAMAGRQFQAPIIGSVKAGYPADRAAITWKDAPEAAKVDRGLKAGDEILGIRGNSAVMNYWLDGRVSRFSDVQMSSALADPDEKFTVTFQRDVNGQARIGAAEVGVRKLKGRLAFGVTSPSDVVFGENPGWITDSPFRKGDRLEAIDGRPIGHSWDIPPAEAGLAGGKVTVTVRRDGEELDIQVQPALYAKADFVWLANGRRIRGDILGVSEDGKKLILQPADGDQIEIDSDDIAGGPGYEILDILGLIPRMRISGVEKDSPAAKAGLRPGDIIVGYGDAGATTFRRFRKISEQIAGDGANITVQRGAERKTFKIKPGRKDDNVIIGILHNPDLAHLVVAGVRAGSPAADASVPPGATITAVNDQPVKSWGGLYETLKSLAGKTASIAYRIGDSDRTFHAKLTPAVFDGEDYQYAVFSDVAAFQPLLVTIQKDNPAGALWWGIEETGKLIVMNYLSIKSMIQGTVSTKEVMGPVGIGTIAIEAGRKGLTDFVYFIAFISAVLAVMNFLPIPVVDGGHMVYLIIEKIRGKPLPVRIINISQVIGMALLGGVFIAITWQDITRIIRSGW